MAKVVFRGSEHFRELNAADLKKAGVEEGFSKTLFARDEAHEVDDKVAEALINTPELFGKFEAAEDEPEESAVEEKADTKPAKSGSKQESTSSTTSTTTQQASGTARA